MELKPRKADSERGKPKGLKRTFYGIETYGHHGDGGVPAES